VHQDLDLLKYIKILNYCRNILIQNFMPRDRAIIDMHVKEVIHNVKEANPEES
jgi:hypothetical protein